VHGGEGKSRCSGGFLSGIVEVFWLASRVVMEVRGGELR